MESPQETLNEFAAVLNAAPAKSMPVPPQCLDAEIHGCVALMKRRGFSFSDREDLDTALARNKDVDVNGKLIHAREVFLSGYLTGFSALQISTVHIQYTPDLRVEQVSISLPSDPEYAKTTGDYDQTGLYAAVSLMIGPECLGSDLTKTSVSGRVLSFCPTKRESLE